MTRSRLARSVLGTAAVVVLALASGSCDLVAPEVTPAPAARSVFAPFRSAPSSGSTQPGAAPTSGSSRPSAAPTKPAAASQPVSGGSGQGASLSQSELNGKWTGSLTITGATYPPDLTPEEKAQCEEQLAQMKDKPIPMEMEFEARSGDSGTVSFTMIDPQAQEKPQKGEPSPYSYRNGVLTVESKSEDGVTRMEARTGKSGGKLTLDGSWKYTGGVDTGAAAQKDAKKYTFDVQGTWAASK